MLLLFYKKEIEKESLKRLGEKRVEERRKGAGWKSGRACKFFVGIPSSSD